MQKFEGISFLWALALLGCVAAVYALRACIGYWNVSRDAEIDFLYKHSHNMLPANIDKDGYIRAYKRFNNPRGLAHMAGGLLAILVLTAPALLLIQTLLHKFWIFKDKSRVFEPGFLVWQFILFFSLIGIWAGIAYVTALHYHRGTSISLKDELIKERQR